MIDCRLPAPPFIMLHIVLYEPEIPPNTGNVMRLAANTGAALHLVKPLGFALRDRELERAGMDYRTRSRLTVHACWTDCIAALGERRLFALTTRGMRNYAEASYADEDVLVFGPETRGLPHEVLEAFPAERRLRIPMTADSRSLNLANAAAVVVYEAWRQLDFRLGN